MTYMKKVHHSIYWNLHKYKRQCCQNATMFHS